MNNSTRNFTNSSNAQNTANSSSKFKKLATAAALAGALIAGGASYQYFKKDKVEAKTENTVGTNEENLNDGKTVVLTDIQQTNRENEGSENDDAEYDRAILEIDMALENERITRDSIKLVEEIKKIDEDTKKIDQDIKKIEEEGKKIEEEGKKIEEEGKKIDADSKRIAKNRKKARVEMEALWASVDENVFKSSKEVQDALDEYFQWAKENWYEPIPHAKYLASLKK